MREAAAENVTAIQRHWAYILPTDCYGLGIAMAFQHRLQFCPVGKGEEFVAVQEEQEVRRIARQQPLRHPGGNLLLRIAGCFQLQQFEPRILPFRHHRGTRIGRSMVEKNDMVKKCTHLVQERSHQRGFVLEHANAGKLHI